MKLSVRLAAVILCSAVAAIINGAMIIPAFATGAEGITTFTGSSSSPIVAAVNSGNGTGVGASSGNAGIAVQGSIGATNTGIGVRGVTYGSGSVALIGEAKSMSGSPSIGVEGFSANGYGIYAKSMLGTSSALFAKNLNSNGGTAVQAVAIGNAIIGQSSLSNGVVGQTSQGVAAGSRAGLLGEDLSTKGASNVGVAGTSTNGIGVSGTSINSIGVSGNSTNRIGIYGTSENDFGVVGQSLSQGSGVWGIAAQGIGVYGISESGVGVRAQNLTDLAPALFVVGGSGLGGTNGALVVVNSEDMGLVCGGVSEPVGGDVMSIDQKGNMILCGTLTTSMQPLVAHRSLSGQQVGTYAAQQTVPTIEDLGQAHLINGQAYVRLDPTFAETADPRANYLVFITPEGESHGLYVTQKTRQGFVVRENAGGRSSLAFDYRIVTKPYDANSRRMPLVRTLSQHSLGPSPKPGTLTERLSAPSFGVPLIHTGLIPKPLPEPAIEKITRR